MTRNDKLFPRDATHVANASALVGSGLVSRMMMTGVHCAGGKGEERCGHHQCRMTKTTRVRCKNRHLKRVGGISPPTAIGELFAADHKIMDLYDEPRHDHRNAIKANAHRKQHLVRRIPISVPEAREFITVCQDLYWTHDTNSLHRSESNGITGRAVPRVKEGTARFQSGLPDQWWDCAMECCCHFPNVHDKMADGKTASETTLGVTSDGPLIPFGVKVRYRAHLFEKRCEACFLEYGGDLLIADCEDLEKLSPFDIHAKQIKRQEVAHEGKLLFPCADESLKSSIFLNHPHGEMRARRHPEQDEKRG